MVTAEFGGTDPFLLPVDLSREVHYGGWGAMNGQVTHMQGRGQEELDAFRLCMSP